MTLTVGLLLAGAIVLVAGCAGVLLRRTSTEVGAPVGIESRDTAAPVAVNHSPEGRRTGPL